VDGDIVALTGLVNKPYYKNGVVRVLQLDPDHENKCLVWLLAENRTLLVDYKKPSPHPSGYVMFTKE
jgi:hypothetical protein